jgi:hypothetical protein
MKTNYTNEIQKTMLLAFKDMGISFNQNSFPMSTEEISEVIQAIKEIKEREGK